MSSANTRAIEAYCESIPGLHWIRFYAGDAYNNSDSTKVLYLSNESMHGLARGKVKIKGRSWKIVLDKLMKHEIDVNFMARMPWIE